MARHGLGNGPVSTLPAGFVRAELQPAPRCGRRDSRPRPPRRLWTCRRPAWPPRSSPPPRPWLAVCCSSSVRRVGELHRSLMTKPVDVQVVCAQRRRVSPMPAAPGALSPRGRARSAEWRGSIAPGRPAAEAEKQAAPKSQAWLGAGCGGGGVVRTEHLVRAGGRGF